MCAINGFNFKDEILIQKMNQKTIHRGPDGSGTFFADDLSLGHNRLSIIDLSNLASQPMLSTDGNLVLIFNGEIYNFQELKKELTSSYNFKSRSDSEVILAAYEKWGTKAFSKLNGMFSLALYDKKKKELILARDISGIKPLYYSWDGDKLIFSSEIKGILEHPIKRVVDREALCHYFTLLYVPSPFTLFKDIKKLPAGHFAVYKEKRFSLSSYVFEPEKKSLSGDKEKDLRDTIHSAVERQLISDRPLGIFLSGGIDSSVILYEISTLKKQIETFSVGFEVPEGGNEKFNADFNLARETAKHFGTNHNELFITTKDVRDSLDRVFYHMDEPIGSATAVSRFLLSEFASKKVTVALGGEGGDEIFGGYERYRLSTIISKIKSFPQFLQYPFKLFPSLSVLNTGSSVDRYACFMFQKSSEFSSVLRESCRDKTRSFFEEKYFKDKDSENFEEKFMEVDRNTWLIDQALMLSDKMSMASSLEMRVPLLDSEVIKFADTLPIGLKVNPFKTKIILKRAYKDNLPAYLFNQPKRGWFSPGAKWLRHPALVPVVGEALSSNYHEATSKIFNWEEVSKMLKDHQNGKSYHANTLWALLAFQKWAKTFNLSL